MHLTYSEVKSLLLSSTDPSPAESAGTTQTGGRLNVGAAMAALALLLQERGEGQLPGGFLEDAFAAEQLQQRMLQTSWGQGLLQSAAPSALPQGSSGEGGLQAQAQHRRAALQAKSGGESEEAALGGQAQAGRAAPPATWMAGRGRQLRAGRSLVPQQASPGTV